MASPLAAQTEANPKHEWVDHLYPYVSYSSIDGFWAAGHYDWSSPMGFAERPEPNFGRVALDAGASTQGSYLIIADAQAPAYWDGWRLGLSLSLARANRLGYYGQGNSTTYNRDSTVGHSYFYRVSRKTAGARPRSASSPAKPYINVTAWGRSTMPWRGPASCSIHAISKRTRTVVSSRKRSSAEVGATRGPAPRSGRMSIRWNA